MRIRRRVNLLGLLPTAWAVGLVAAVLIGGAGCSVPATHFHVTPGLRILRRDSFVSYHPPGTTTTHYREQYKHESGPVGIADHFPDSISWSIDPRGMSSAGLRRELERSAEVHGWTVDSSIGATSPVRPSGPY